MARSYKFAVIRFAPDDVRGERINVGVVVFREDGIDVRMAHKMGKLKSISAAASPGELRELVHSLPDVDSRLRSAGVGDEDRLRFISRIGPLALSDLGQFIADRTNDYEDRVFSILKAMVDPEPAPRRLREKRSRLLSQIKTVLKKERVLASKEEDISSHRVVPLVELDEGLVADLVLKNGRYHVIETVDASGDEESLRKAIAEIGVASLVLERARMAFGEGETEARLVYSASPTLERAALPSLQAAENQGATLVNWESESDRERLLHSLVSLATPRERKKPQRRVKFAGPGSDGFKLN